MDLKEFATLAGVKVIRCDSSWGGTWGYTEDRYSNFSVCGYRNENAVYRGWAKSTFGDGTYKALQKLLNQSEKVK